MIDTTQDDWMHLAERLIGSFMEMYEDYHGKFNTFNMTFELCDETDVIGEVKLGSSAFDVISFVQLFEGKDGKVRELYEKISEEYKEYLVTIERKG